MKSFVFFCITAISAAGSTGDVDFTSIGKIAVSKPAFIKMTGYEDEGDGFLLVSSFSASPMSHGSISVVTGIKDALLYGGDISALSPTKLDTPKFTWPNAVEVVPFDTFDPSERAIHVPDGFLVPGHKNGGVYVLRMDQTDLTTVIETVKISPDKDDYFYHMGEWIDMNGDGRKDFITARSNAEVGGGELVWFENPESGLDATPWTEHFVTSGPDVIFECDMFSQYNNEIVIFAA